jgi:hypothetical protein
MPQAWPGLHCGDGVLTTLGVTTIAFVSPLARAIEAEYIEEALKPATARATTKVRMAMFFMMGISPWRYRKDF